MIFSCRSSYLNRKTLTPPFEMSQIPIENDDNRSVAASDVVQLDQPDEVPDQEAQQLNLMIANLKAKKQTVQRKSLKAELMHELKDEFGKMLSTQSEQHLKEMAQLKDGFAKEMAQLEAKIQTLQSKLENLELKAEIRAMKENAEHKATYQEEHHTQMAQLKDGFAKEMAQQEDGFAQMLSTQNEQHQQQMEQLESKNRKLEEKLMGNVEVQTTKNGVLDTKMEQLHDEFTNKLAEQQKQMTQFQEIIQQKLEQFREEMDQKGQQAIGSNMKLDYMWSQLMSKGKRLANPKGIFWNRSKTEANISECGLNLKATGLECFFAIATEGYAISAEDCRKENCQFPGTIFFYYEVTKPQRLFGYCSIGFTDGSKPPAGCDCVGGSPNSYGTGGHDANSLWLSGKKHKLECSTAAIARGDVVGSGLLLNSKNELAVFFTANGILCGKQIRIYPTVDRLYPTVFTFGASVEANFGGNLAAKPFKFDTDKWPGLVFE